MFKLSGLPGDTVVDLGTASPLQHRVGFSPFDLFTYDIVSATYDPVTKKAINSVSADGAGGTIPCFVPRTTSVQAPKVYFGHSIPTSEGSLSSTLRYRRLRLYVLTDFQSGFKKLDDNLRINCQLNSACKYAIYPADDDPAIVAVVQNSGTLRDFFINTANFSKLREVSLSYDAPDYIASRLRARSLGVTASARNLRTRTRYTGLDPENSLGGQTGSIALDQSERAEWATSACSGTP